MKYVMKGLSWIDENGKELEDMKLKKKLDIEAEKLLIYPGMKKRVECEFDEEDMTVEYFTVDDIIVDRDFTLIPVYEGTFAGVLFSLEELRLGGKTVLWCAKIIDADRILWHSEAVEVKKILMELLEELYIRFEHDLTELEIGLDIMVKMMRKLIERGDL